MPHLNLKHMRYFWAVATHGSIARAAEILHLTPQTISGQLRELEEQVGDKLFAKSGRGLALTETGRLVFSYADDIFRLGEELEDVLAGRTPTGGLSLNVGIAMVVPKLLTHRVLAPVLAMPEPVRLVCAERPLVELLADLSVHKLDLVLADSPLSPALNIRAYSHPLGESATSFFAATAKAEALMADFPASLHGAPMLMPSSASAPRRSLELWLEHQQVQPRVVAEIDDRALMKTFGEAGAGIFTAPQSVEADVLAKYQVRVIGRAPELKERLFAITAERRIKHPAVSLITEAARRGDFS
ncbi:transcriptional activator NhaR [Lamprobacter modestohalophilus]|uniref:transcriptional activator NhaR n=1 Tax=Lamprobacter modestohalophilus TaxID=1064514 RepID=UPI002ADEB50C|nr:transcriptional activator NhaR [Lamprobacter modestohalophilus]MEA1052514.1 transcriptional activator NhaR [Lamprobacter modestohalophilus]